MQKHTKILYAKAGLLFAIAGANSALLAETKYLKDYHTKNRLDGDTFWLKLVYLF